MGLIILLAMSYSWQAIRFHLRNREIAARLPKGWLVNWVGVVRFPQGEPVWKYPEWLLISGDVFASRTLSGEWWLYHDAGKGSVDIYTWFPEDNKVDYKTSITNTYLSKCEHAVDASGEVVALPDSKHGGFLFIARDRVIQRQKFQTVFASNKKYCFWCIDGTSLLLYNAHSNHTENVIVLPVTVSKVKASTFTVSRSGSYVAFVSGYKKGFIKEYTKISVYRVSNSSIHHYTIKHFPILSIDAVDERFIIAYSVVPVIGRSWVVILDLESGEYLVWKEFPAIAFCPRFIPNE